jgi:hypothetical protein
VILNGSSVGKMEEGEKAMLGGRGGYPRVSDGKFSRPEEDEKF